MSRHETADFHSADGDDAAVLTIKRDPSNGRVLMRIGEDGAIFVATQQTAVIVAGFIRYGDAPLASGDQEIRSNDA